MNLQMALYSVRSGTCWVGCTVFEHFLALKKQIKTKIMCIKKLFPSVLCSGSRSSTHRAENKLMCIC